MHTVPELRQLQQYVNAIDLIAGLIAERTGREAGELPVRAMAGAVVGVSMAGSAHIVEGAHELADYERIDEALALLERGPAARTLRAGNFAGHAWVRPELTASRIGVGPTGVRARPGRRPGRSGRVIASICVAGPIERMGRRPGDRYAMAVVRAGQRLPPVARRSMVHGVTELGLPAESQIPAIPGRSRLICFPGPGPACGLRRRVVRPGRRRRMGADRWVTGFWSDDMRLTGFCSQPFPGCGSIRQARHRHDHLHSRCLEYTGRERMPGIRRAIPILANDRYVVV